MVVECYHKGQLVARHLCSDEPLPQEVLKRFGLIGSRLVVKWYPDGRPDKMTTIYQPGSYIRA
jgi:hypothetical protein